MTGINDAPALADTHAEITISTGTDLAIEAADLVLMSSVRLLRGVPNPIALSKATIRNIK